MEAYVRLAMTSDPTTEAARTLRRVMADGVPKQIRERRAQGTMDKTQRAVFFHLLFLSLNPTPPELLRASGKSAKKQIALRVRAADTYKFPEARPWISNRPLSRSHREVAAIEDGVLVSDATDAFIAKFLAAKLLGQRFMHEDEREIAFTDAVPRLLLLYPMAIWTAKALAADAGEPEVHEEQVRNAIRLLDRSFGQVRLGDLPPKQRKAWRFVMTETELPVVATLDLLHAYNAR